MTLEKPSNQLSLFDEFECVESTVNEKQSQIDQIKDSINDKFGKGSVKSAVELKSNKANMVAVISPAWRKGLSCTVEDYCFRPGLH